MEQIKMVDLVSQYHNIESEIKDAINNVIESSQFIKGNIVGQFEKNLARFLNVKHVVSCGSGTDALRISLLSLGLKPGDEVVTPSFTFVATAEVAASIGCRPILVDVDDVSFCMSVESVRKAITPHTKAIVPVHLFGQSAPMAELQKICDEKGLFLIEDACQAINADYIAPNTSKRHKLGTMGVAGCLSFFPSKNLGCFGDGGAILTNDDTLAEKARSIANHGMKIKYHYERIGMNSRLDSIQAAVLNTKLKYLDQYTAKRQCAAQIYDQLLSDCPLVETPQRMDYSTHVFHQYTIKVKHGQRDGLKEYLKEHEIPSMVYYPIPLHAQPPYQNMHPDGEEFTNTNKLAEEVLSLPMHTELSLEQQKYIAENIKNFSKKMQ